MSKQERVHTMTDYYDGPRGGVADFNGRPHVYRSMWANIDFDGADVFELAPIDERTLALALEDWQIWRRWESSFQRGETTQDTHPALPDDRERHDELTSLLDPLLRTFPDAEITATADFVWPSVGSPSIGAPLGVTWTLVNRPTDSSRVDDDMKNTPV